MARRQGSGSCAGSSRLRRDAVGRNQSDLSAPRGAAETRPPGVPFTPQGVAQGADPNHNNLCSVLRIATMALNAHPTARRRPMVERKLRLAPHVNKTRTATLPKLFVLD